MKATIQAQSEDHDDDDDDVTISVSIWYQDKLNLKRRRRSSNAMNLISSKKQKANNGDSVLRSSQNNDIQLRGELNGDMIGRGDSDDINMERDHNRIRSEEQKTGHSERRSNESDNRNRAVAEGGADAVPRGDGSENHNKGRGSQGDAEEDSKQSEPDVVSAPRKQSTVNLHTF